jgi:hypothetical protein
MSLTNEIAEICWRVHNGGGIQEFELSGHSQSTLSTIRVYVSRFNQGIGTSITTKYNPENRSVLIGFAAAFKRNLVLKFEPVNIPVGIYRFMQGRDIGKDQVEKIRDFSLKLAARLRSYDLENRENDDFEPDVDLDDVLKMQSDYKSNELI